MTYRARPLCEDALAHRLVEFETGNKYAASEAQLSRWLRLAKMHGTSRIIFLLRNSGGVVLTRRGVGERSGAGCIESADRELAPRYSAALIAVHIAKRDRWGATSSRFQTTL